MLLPSVGIVSTVVAATARLPSAFAGLGGGGIFVVVVAGTGCASSDVGLPFDFGCVGLGGLWCGRLFREILVMRGVLVLQEDLWLVLA